MYHTTCSDVYDNTALLSTFVSSTDDINVTDNWLLTVNIVLVARHKSKTRGTRLETETVAFETKTRTGGTRLETETVASDTETKTGDEDRRHETGDRDCCLRDRDEDRRHETPDRDSYVLESRASHLPLGLEGTTLPAITGRVKNWFLLTKECIPGVSEANMMDKAATHYVDAVIVTRSDAVETSTQWTLYHFCHGFCARRRPFHLSTPDASL